MRKLSLLITTCFVLLAHSTGYCSQCCEGMACISYCDTSAGRYVCNNGDYSTCYCTRHAVMDLQLLAGCCLWQGGVLKIIPETNIVICNNGTISEICSIQKPTSNKVSLYH